MQKLKALFQKPAVTRAAKVAGTVALMGAGTAFAADDNGSQITAIQVAAIATIGLASAAGFTVMAAALAPDLAMSITKKFIKKGAK